MYCQKCGTENIEEAKFCKDCGYKIITEPIRTLNAETTFRKLNTVKSSTPNKKKSTKTTFLIILKNVLAFIATIIFMGSVVFWLDYLFESRTEAEHNRVNELAIVVVILDVFCFFIVILWASLEAYLDNTPKKL